ncbi:MAG: hypothetical protein ACP5O0_08865 [Acidimicrobiales bacterium]
MSFCFTLLVLGVILMRLRSHLGIATTALVLVIPVLVGVVSGGFAIGVLGALVGFVVYDFFSSLRTTP